jgi:hypothetical protein
MKSRTYGQCFFQKRQQIYNLLFWFGSCILVYCFLGASCSLILALNRPVMSFEAMLLDPFCWHAPAGSKPTSNAARKANMKIK